MRVLLSANELKDKVAIVSKAVPKKSIRSSLSGFLFEAKNGELFLYATDLETGVKASVRFVDLEGEGKFFVSADTFKDVVKALPTKDVELVLKDDVLIVTSQRTTYRVPTMPVDEFPEIVPSKEGLSFEIDTSLLSEMVEKTIFAAAKDELMRNLHGVLWECENNALRLVASDGFRLALAEEPIEVEEKFSFVLSLKSMQEIENILSNTTMPSVVVRYDGKKASLFVGDVETVVRALDVEFPDYKRVLPTSFMTTITCSRKELQEALKRVMVVTKDSVRFEIEEGLLRVVAKAPDVGEAVDELEVQKDGEDLKVAFNPRFILEGLKQVDTDDVELAFAGADKPARMAPVGLEGYVYIVMPVRMAGEA